MVEKRPFEDGKTFDVSSKHPRLVENPNELVSFSETVFSREAYRVPQPIGGDELHRDNTQGEEHLVNASDIIVQATGSTKENSTSEENSGLGTTLHVPFFPEFCNSGNSIRTLDHCDDIYSLLLNFPPRKQVALGPDHQAYIPELGVSLPTKNTSNDLVTGSGILGFEEDEKLMMGTCVIPMPHLGPSEHERDIVGKGRCDCSCEDGGSVRCTRQHIVEAREKLKVSLGLSCFMQLGFPEMGEIVAEKWSEAEENLFSKIVLSNPASMGRNFWVILSAVFPDRTKMDIVSYYFNVFMLRRRTEQNRCYSLNVDSDDDEWLENDDSGYSKFGLFDEEEMLPGLKGNFVYLPDQEDETCCVDYEKNPERLVAHEVEENSCTLTGERCRYEKNLVRAGLVHCCSDSYNELSGKDVDMGI